TPMGPSNIEPPSKNPDGTIKLPKSFNADVIAAAAQNILGQSTLDRNQVSFNPEGQNNNQGVTFTNGAQGAIHIGLQNVPNMPGFRAELSRADLAGGDKAIVIMHYERPADSAEPQPFTFQLVVEPLNQSFPIRVTFTKPDGQ